MKTDVEPMLPKREDMLAFRGDQDPQTILRQQRAVRDLDRKHWFCIDARMLEGPSIDAWIAAALNAMHEPPYDDPYYPTLLVVIKTDTAVVDLRLLNVETFPTDDASPDIITIIRETMRASYDEMVNAPLPKGGEPLPPEMHGDPYKILPESQHAAWDELVRHITEE